MINEKVQNAINEQIKNELFSAYLYLSMSAYFEEKNLPGFAHWMRIQSQEEVEHAMKFFDFINDRGGKVTLFAIEQPKTAWKSALEAMKDAYAHEQLVTSMINNIYEIALTEKDYPAQVMLHWFIDEQVEEEKNASEIVEQLKLIEERGSAMLMLDRQLAQREED
ncbi:MAG: ferritin [Anaerolineales bacterium]|nr:ferritin [Anaerolineales bacterium]